MEAIRPLLDRADSLLSQGDDRQSYTSLRKLSDDSCAHTYQHAEMVEDHEVAERPSEKEMKGILAETQEISAKKKRGGTIESLFCEVNNMLQPVIKYMLDQPKSSLFSPASKDSPSNFLNSCETGDLILESSVAPRAAMTRLLTQDRISHLVMILKHPTLNGGKPFVVGSGGLTKKYKFQHVIQSPEIKDAVYHDKYHVGPYCVPLSEYLAYYERSEYTEALVRRLIIDDTKRTRMSDMLRKIVDSSWEQSATFEEVLMRLFTRRKLDDAATCSQSVGMFMSKMGISSMDPDLLWKLKPGAFTAGGLMDQHLVDGVRYSKEIYLRLRSQPVSEKTTPVEFAYLEDKEIEVVDLQDKENEFVDLQEKDNVFAFLKHKDNEAVNVQNADNDLIPSPIPQATCRLQPA